MYILYKIYILNFTHTFITSLTRSQCLGLIAGFFKAVIKGKVFRNPSTTFLVVSRTSQFLSLYVRNSLVKFLNKCMTISSISSTLICQKLPVLHCFQEMSHSFTNSHISSNILSSESIVFRSILSG